MSPFSSFVDGGTSSTNMYSFSSTSNAYIGTTSPPTSLYDGNSCPSNEFSPSRVTTPYLILAPLSIYDANSIRRVQIHIYNLLDGNTCPPENLALQDAEVAVFERIRALLSNNPHNQLFHEICDKFAAASECTDRGVCKAAEDFNLLCLDGVLEPCEERKYEFAVVERLVKLMETAGDFAYEIAEEVNLDMNEAFATEREALRIVNWVAVNHEDGEVGENFETAHDTPAKLPAVGAYGGVPSSKLANIDGKHGSNDFGYHSHPSFNHDGLPSRPLDNLVWRSNKKRKCAVMQASFDYGDSEGEEDADASEYEQSEDGDEGEEVSDTSSLNHHCSGPGADFYEYLYSSPNYRLEPLQAGEIHSNKILAEASSVAGNDSSEGDDDQVLFDLLSREISEEGARGVSPGSGRSNTRHKPILGRDERALEDGTYDRATAKPGFEDKSKLTIVLNRERADKSGDWHRVPPAKYVYKRKVIWDQKESVIRLNQWRCQVFRRALGVQRDRRPKWTTAEHDTLKLLLKQHLSQDFVNGRWGRVPWSSLRMAFNNHFEGRVFPQGEPLAPVTDNLETDKRGFSLTIHRHDTPFAKRSLAAIMAHLSKSADEELHQMICRAKDWDEQDRLQGYVGGDEDDDGLPKKRQRTTKAATAGSRSKKAKTATVKAVRKTKAKSAALSKSRPLSPFDNDTNTAEQARASKPVMVDFPKTNDTSKRDAPEPDTFAGTIPFPNIPINAADMMRFSNITNPPPKHFFRHVPKFTKSGSEDGDMTEDELEWSLGTGEHAFVKFVRAMKANSAAASSSPGRPLSPFRDLEVGCVKKGQAYAFTTDMASSPAVEEMEGGEAQNVEHGDAQQEMSASTRASSPVDNLSVEEVAMTQSSASSFVMVSPSGSVSPHNSTEVIEVDQAIVTSSPPAPAEVSLRPRSSFEYSITSELN